ncbi:MAG: hypothetical protein ACREHE_13775 [Rhizomicrobium sp.]
MRTILVAAALASVVVMTGAAYADVEEVVVTAERRDESGPPHIFVVKRADHLIATVTVTCDTRDAKQRMDELKTTLRDLIRAAASTKTISLGVGDSVLGDLNEADFDEIIEPDSRPDSSRASVVVKTAVAKDDTFNSATARIKDFIARATRTCRSEIIRQNRWDLTVIGPEQYRDRLVTQIVADARHTADLFGAGYGITIEGLEHPVTWSQQGPLDLALYIPYTLHIAPK